MMLVVRLTSWVILSENLREGNMKECDICGCEVEEQYSLCGECYAENNPEDEDREEPEEYEDEEEGLI